MLDFPRCWFWLIAETGQRWSSASAAFVESSQDECTTRIATVSELNAVLRANGLPVAVLEACDLDAAVTAHIDIVARERDFYNAADATAFASSTQAEWSAEALAFIAWRDSVWLAFDAAKAKLPATTAEFISGLPAIVWPQS